MRSCFDHRKISIIKVKCGRKWSQVNFWYCFEYIYSIFLKIERQRWSKCWSDYSFAGHKSMVEFSFDQSRWEGIKISHQNYGFKSVLFSVQQDSSLATKISGPITQKNPQKIIEMDTQEIVVHYEFTNSESSKYKGFVLTYKSIGEPASNDESGNSTVTIPLEEYSNMKVLLEVPEAKQNNDTLAQLRLLFAQSANKFIEGEKLAVEQCKIENVRFLDVLRCPMTWPNAVNCIQIVVAIPLKTITNVTASKADTRNTSSTETDVDIDSERIEYELTFAHLIKMWILYGRKHFIENEFIEFAPPNPKNLIMLWTSVCLAVLLVFLLLLYCILKIDLLKDYRRMHWKISDDQSRMCKQSEIDISMFPSPHQAVPTLFPNDLPAYSTAPNTDGGLPFGNHCTSRQPKNREYYPFVSFNFRICESINFIQPVRF